MRISHKLPAIMIGLAAFSILVTTTVAYLDARLKLQDQAQDALVMARDDRSHELQAYLRGIEEDLLLVADSSIATTALAAFSDGYRWLGPEAGPRLRALYVGGSPYPVGARDKLDDAGDGSAYSAAHAKHHPWFHRLQQQRGYYDLFLFNAEGDLIYTVFKEADYATNLRSGEWAGTGLGKAFAAAMAAPVGQAVFEDFAPYAPSQGAPAGFIATAIPAADGGKAGVLAFQMPVDRMNFAMQQYSGMGETGESYLVGGDRLMRTDARGSTDSTILKRRLDTDAVKRALDGQTGRTEQLSPEGTAMVAAYAPLDFLGTRWAVVTEKQAAEVDAAAAELVKEIAIAAIVILALAAIAGLLSARSVVRPLQQMTQAMSRLAGKDWTAEVPAIGRRDEIGEMAAAVQVFKEAGQEVERLQAAQEAERLQAEADKRAAMLDLAQRFESQIGGIVTLVGAAASELQATAEVLNGSMQDTEMQTGAASSGAEQAAASVQTMAAAAEEMSAAVREVNLQVAATASRLNAVTGGARDAEAQMDELLRAVAQIDEVVAQIGDVAEQTNLLALNATIEAARAGEAGKGFAVVAGEVKSLASQTRKMTDNIARQLSAVKDSTDRAVRVTRGIAGEIANVNDSTSAIAASVEEQTATTSEISRSANQAASGTDAVSESLVRVVGASQHAAEASGNVNDSASQLAEQAETLRAAVQAFLSEVRAA